MSGDLRNPSKAIPKGTLWAILTTAVVYLVVILSMASSMSHGSLLRNSNIIQDTNIWPPTILAGECAVTFFSTLMGIIGSAKLMQALCRDQLIPGLSIFGAGSKRSDEPLAAIGLTYAIAQMALFANLNQIATLISMGYQVCHHVDTPLVFLATQLIVAAHLFYHELGLLLATHCICAEFSAWIPILQLAERLCRLCHVRNRNVLHRQHVRCHSRLYPHRPVPPHPLS